jgi:c-di-GMP-binding flagellar brake protein YcgR
MLQRRVLGGWGVRKKQRRLLLRVIGIAVIILINAVALYVWRHQRPEAVRIAAPEIQMLLVKENARCGHSEERFTRISQAKLRVFGQSYQGWRIEGRQGNLLVLKKTEDGLCAICQSEEFLGIASGKVAVVHGRPNRPGPVKELTTLSFDDLPEAEREDLRRGIVFRNSREKLQLLEGLFSLKDG